MAADGGDGVGLEQLPGGLHSVLIPVCHDADAVCLLEFSVQIVFAVAELFCNILQIGKNRLSCINVVPDRLLDGVLGGSGFDAALKMIGNQLLQDQNQLCLLL